MKNPLILGILLIGSYSACYSEETAAPPKEISQVGIGVEVEAGDDGYDDDGGPIIWIGPGLYYGIWFDNEWEYNDWHNHHYHGHHHHHDGHHGGHHDGGHHGGGGHHHDGGHHGGGGHGGGHHH